ncbi:MAG TPA: NnrS family protein [Caulobacteraceae bacterium]|nr:NnrS family protein [Caulobacteraceae bacterium]
MTAAELRAYKGPALFSFGFRPFFLFGALWAALAAPLWAAIYIAGGAELLGQIGRDWHVHEMLFGYLSAVVAGFLLTAVPNWTGRLPVAGAPLAALFGLWAAGRLAMLAAAWIGPAAAVIDSAFLVALAAALWREVAAGRNWRNLPVCVLVSGLALANIGTHLRGPYPALADVAERLALSAPAMLVALIGGRITPSFTLNWLRQHDGRIEPEPFGMVDRAALVGAGAALLAWIAAPTNLATGVLVSIGGLGLLIRMSRWRGAAAAREPLVLVLHAGYAWLAAALALLGGSILAPDVIPRTAAIHALTVGAFGVMTLGVMTRATLGHTGRARAANRLTTAIYAAVNAAALLRVAAAFALRAQGPLLAAVALCWAAAFLGFAVGYGPLLTRPRLA